MRAVILAVLYAMSLLILPSASSLEISDYAITFDILPDGRTNETVSMSFREAPNSSSLSYIVVGEISDLSISSDRGGMDYVLEKSGSRQNVLFTVPEGTGRLSINFIAKDLVFAREGVYGFFTNIDPPGADNISVKAVLPTGYAVYSDAVYPEGCQMLSDGERIYLLWLPDGSEETAVSFKFYGTHSDYSLAVFAVMLLAIAGVTAYLVAHYRKKVRKEFSRGFSEDEGKVLEMLSKKRTCMQNRVEKELGFSRAKMTRIVKKLEGKKLLEKERVGRTNRLFYRKK
jgi:uncharacterized membrane protein